MASNHESAAATAEGTAEFANPYDELAGGTDSKWAFGTGFTDPLAGVDTTLPEGVDGAALAVYCLMLGDDALVFSHRLQEWCTRLPELEEEVAIANIALDLLGQARLLYSRAGAAEGGGWGEDHYAFTRAESAFRNVRLAELPRGDFAELISRLLVLSIWRLEFFARLAGSRDPVLAAVAGKAVVELSYHRDHAVQWTLRLGDGTAESHRRMQGALAQIWPFVPELFHTSEVEQRLIAAGVAVDPAELHDECDHAWRQVLAAATVAVPEVAARPGVSGRAGRAGVHTEHLGYLLAELQSVARAHPGGTW